MPNAPKKNIAYAETSCGIKFVRYNVCNGKCLQMKNIVLDKGHMPKYRTYKIKMAWEKGL